MTIAALEKFKLGNSVTEDLEWISQRDIGGLKEDDYCKADFDVSY